MLSGSGYPGDCPLCNRCFSGSFGSDIRGAHRRIGSIEEINYRLIRGLAQILEWRCVIETDSVIDPIAARRMIFEESREFVTSEQERKTVLDKIARKLSIEPDALETALWADHEGNLVIKEFQTIIQKIFSGIIICPWLRLSFSGPREWRSRLRITTSRCSGRSSSWVSYTR